MEEVIDMLIEEVLSYLKRERRLGFYISEVKSAVQSYRRAQHKPEWLDEGVANNARRIASPILDIIPPVAARMAVLSQDGLPEFAGVLGMVWDEKVQPLTAWIRANLAQHPGHIEIGAIKGIRIVIRTEDAAKAKETPDQNPLPDGTIAIEGDVLLGAADATKEVALGPDVKVELVKIQDSVAPVVAWFNTVLVAANAAGSPIPPLSVPPGPPSTPYAAGDVSATKVKAK